jgi:hypothetical protein
VPLRLGLLTRGPLVYNHAEFSREPPLSFKLSFIQGIGASLQMWMLRSRLPRRHYWGTMKWQEQQLSASAGKGAASHAGAAKGAVAKGSAALGKAAATTGAKAVLGKV